MTPKPYIPKEIRNQDRKITIIAWVYALTVIAALLITLILVGSKPVAQEVPLKASTGALNAKFGVSRTATIYAYSSEIAQTDNSPFITASGKKVREGIIANNCLPLGSEVAIYQETLSGGDKVFRVYDVEDRMNKRYGCDIFDVWQNSKAKAVAFGKQHLEVRTQ